MWAAINYVTSGFALIAFLAAAAAWAYKLNLEGRGRLIRSAKEKERVELVKGTLEFFNIDAAGLTKEQQFKLASEQIKARGRRFTIQAAVLVVVAVCITFYLIAQRSPEYALMRQSTGVDPALVGKWESVGILETSEFQIRFDIGTDGSYSRWYFFDDEGAIEAEQSRLLAKSRTSVIRSELKPVGSNALILTTETAGQIEFKRAGRITEPLDDPVVGTWKGTKLLSGATWEMMMEISAQHNYHFHSEARDNGKLIAQNGSYQMNSRWNTTPIVGTYKVIDDRPELELWPFNTIELKRSR